MTWTEQERGIFSYKSDKEDKDLFADPLQVRRGLLTSSGGFIDDWWEKVCVSPFGEDGETPNKQYMPLQVAEFEGKVATAVRSAFGLKPIDQSTGNGTLDAYCLKLIESFYLWWEKKTLNIATTQILSQPTAGLRGPDPALMNSLSGSSLTQADCGCVKHT